MSLDYRSSVAQNHHTRKILKAFIFNKPNRNFKDTEPRIWHPSLTTERSFPLIFTSEEVITCDQTQEILHPETLDGFLNSVIPSMAFQKYQNTSVKGFDIHLQRRSRFSSISSVLKSKLLNYLLQILPPRVGLMKSNQIIEMTVVFQKL